MGLENFKTEEKSKLDKEKFRKDELCPSCGKKGKHLRGMEYKCTTPSEECGVITWYNSNY